MSSASLRSVGAALVVPLMVLVAWELTARLGRAPDFLVAPSRIVQSLFALGTSGELWLHLGSSLVRALGGFCVGSALGVMLGLGAGSSRALGSFFDPLISVIYPVPKIAFMPIIIIWLGIGEASKIATISLSVFFPAFISAYLGAQSVNTVYLWAARAMGSSRLREFFLVVFPAALPQILSGLRIGLGLSFVVLFAAELVGAREGLGFLVGQAEDNRRYDLMFVAILMIGVAGFISDRLLLAARRWLLSGQTLSKEEYSA